jgi:hypothetical protein
MFCNPWFDIGSKYNLLSGGARIGVRAQRWEYSVGSTVWGIQLGHVLFCKDCFFSLLQTQILDSPSSLGRSESC